MVNKFHNVKLFLCLKVRPLSVSTRKVTKSLLYLQKYRVKKYFFTQDCIKISENVIFY